MKMRIEKYREVHKLIWNTVILHAEEIKTGETSITEVKRQGLHEAYNKGIIDINELIVISEAHYCMFCAFATSCSDCILGSCSDHLSLYDRASRGDKVAMEEIRDVVDKWPFTKLSIVDLR